MKKTIHNEEEKLLFIMDVQATEIKGNYLAEFTKIRRKRSLESNAYLWLILTIGQEETGNTKDDLYVYMLDKYPTMKEITINDKIYLIPISSSAFNSLQMSHFIENVRGELASIGVQTPDADSDKCMDIYNHYRERGLI